MRRNRESTRRKGARTKVDERGKGMRAGEGKRPEIEGCGEGGGRRVEREGRGRNFLEDVDEFFVKIRRGGRRVLVET